eukprot:5698723-Amphidinium_carterae.1
MGQDEAAIHSSSSSEALRYMLIVPMIVVGLEFDRIGSQQIVNAAGLYFLVEKFRRFSSLVADSSGLGTREQ